MNTDSARPNDPIPAELSRRTSRDRLVKVALSILRDRAEAEDAAHDAVVHALRGSGSFGGQSLVSTWLHRVAVNTALMRVREKRRASKWIAANYQRGDEDRLNLADLVCSSSTPEDSLLNWEERCRLHTAIATLPSSYRDVLELYILEERTLPEVARSLGISSEAVRARVHRAREQLRERLAA